MVNIVNTILIDFSIIVFYILSNLHLNIERHSLSALFGGGGRASIRDRLVGRREIVVMIHSGFFRPIGRNLAAPIVAAAVMGFSSGAIADTFDIDGGTAHRDELVRPIELGVSGSSIEFLQIDGVFYCYAGTLGALVEDAATPSLTYVLSNNHVLARENQATIGEPVIQPGLLDENGIPTSCSAAGTDYTPYTFGSLSDWVTLNFKKLPFGRPNNTVDAAIAAVDALDVDSSGWILDIGVIDPVPASAAVDMVVMKSGRTTGLTHGMVAAVDVSVAVLYSSGYALFKNQVRIAAEPDQAFIKGGDSGSLLVTNPGDGTAPQAVGLLFAGNDTGSNAFANSIEDVLNAFGVNMAGCSANTACAGGGSSGGGGGKKGGGKGGGGGKPKAGFEPFGLDLASQAKARHEEELFLIRGVVGTGIGADEDGNAVIEVYVKGAAKQVVGEPIPDDLDGIPVRVIETGEIRAF